MKRRPNEPVPPVTRMTLPSRSRLCGAKRPKACDSVNQVASIWPAPDKETANHVSRLMAAMNRRRLLLALALLAAPDGALAEERKKGGGETFIQIQTLTATVIRPDGRRGVMTVESGVDVP